MVKIMDTLYIPSLDRCLLYVPKITQHGLELRFGLMHCSIWKSNELLNTAKRYGNMYTLNVEHEHAMLVAHVEQGSEWDMWHARLRHTSVANYVKTQAATTGLPNMKRCADSDLCGRCLKRIMTVASFPKTSTTKTTNSLQLVHSDVVGPMENKSAGGFRYISTFVDDYSGFVTVYFLKAKSEVPARFNEYKLLMEKQCNAHIKRIRTDNGGEYKNKRFAEICGNSGIIHQTTVPYNPQQNGVAERMNRTIVDKARSMMHCKCCQSNGGRRL